MKKILGILAIFGSTVLPVSGQGGYIHPLKVYVQTATGGRNWYASGEEIKIMVTIEVKQAPQKIMTSSKFRPEMGPPMPVLVLGTKPPGIHNLTVAIIKVPLMVPERLSVDILINGQVMVSNFLFKRKEPGKMEIFDYFITQLNDIYPAPEAISNGGRADLVFKIGQTFKMVGGILQEDDKIFYIENIGTAGAQHVNVRYECFVNGRWVSGNSQLERIIFLSAGSSQTVKNFKSLACTGSATRWRIIADPDNQIAELDEANNIYEIGL